LAETLILIKNLAKGWIIFPTGSRQLLCNINTIVGLTPMSNLINARYLLGEHPEKMQIANLLGLAEIDQLPTSDAEVVVILTSTKNGVDQEILSNWQTFREGYVPVIIVVLDFDQGEVDFEDMSAILGKMLEPVVTPYLVLHADDGKAVGLINLESLQVTDYSTENGLERESDPEHKELVKEFAEELKDALVEGGWEQFVQALIIPAIPLRLENSLGINEIKRFLDLIPSRS
jgi:hypothetical protein